MKSQLRNIVPGPERFAAGHVIPRHRHDRAYAIVTLSGSLEQVSYAGRIATRAGQLLVQPTLDCHANSTGTGGCEILRLPWRRESGLGGLFELEEIDVIVRLAERDPTAAARCASELVDRGRLQAPKREDWEDLLAADITAGRVASLRAWAETHSLALETPSRGFARRYHCTPARFRCEVRARNAWLRLTAGSERLADVAAETGFSDQAHMTRSIASLTGASPMQWRRRAAG